MTMDLNFQPARETLGADTHLGGKQRKQIMGRSTAQKNIFLAAEGDQWFARNKQSFDQHDTDIIIETLRSIELVPARVLEIGCGSSHRLELMRKVFNSKC